MNIEHQKKAGVVLLGQLPIHTVYKYVNRQPAYQRHTYLVLQQQCHYFENVHRAGKRMVLDVVTDVVCQHDMDQVVVIYTHRLIVAPKAID